MGRDKTRHNSRSTTRAQATTQHTAQQQDQHAVEFDQQLHYLQSHYQNGRYAQFPEAAQGRYAMEAAQLAVWQQQQQQEQQGQVWQSTRASRPAKPGFLDTLGTFTDSRGEQQQRAWLERHGLRGRDPRGHVMYPFLPARMREDYSRRVEMQERMARENQVVRMEELAAAEYKRRYHNLTYVSDLVPRGQEQIIGELRKWRGR
ncbi:hypothetical protein E4U55_006223 [Claviceps digitariae]|nr:hypothetical protein E4U55_006223 [Claviceps digitariae]